MPGLFDYLEAINSGKSLEIDEDAGYKDYVPFQINNGLSQHIDTVLLANEMNKRPWLSKEMQFKFLNSTVTKKKRFGKWAKAETETNQEDINLVAEFYQVNHSRAIEYLSLLDAEQLSAIKAKSNKGGAEEKKGRAKK